MNINFRKPKYILPLILLPFLLILNYGMQSFSSQEDHVPDNGKAELQEGMGDVSLEIRNRGIEDKLDAFRSRYKMADGYTAINNLKLDVEPKEEILSRYNEEEKRMLDSIDRAFKSQYPNGSVNAVSNTPSTGSNIGSQDYYPEKTFHFPPAPPSDKPSPPANRYDDPMELFRAQMALIDSMGRVNEPSQDEIFAKTGPGEELEGTPKLKVGKPGEATGHFNSVFRKTANSPIQAIVDEDIRKGTMGDRLRIRLLDDIKVGGFIVPKGHHLYATISGYEAQRVKLTITNVMLEDKILPVQLSLYDHDGLEGLYVPASAFREFSKNMGANVTGGMNLQMQPSPGSVNQMYLSALQRLFTSGSQVLAKSIRQNKVNLKYGTVIYLMDPEEIYDQ
jgi:hypothetical protein